MVAKTERPAVGSSTHGEGRFLSHWIFPPPVRDNLAHFLFKLFSEAMQWEVTVKSQIPAWFMPSYEAKSKRWCEKMWQIKVSLFKKTCNVLMTALWQQMSNVSERKSEWESRKHAVEWSNVSRRNLLMPPAPTEQEKKPSSKGLSDVPLKVQ